MSNKSNGNRFEQEMAKKLADAGFWVHVMQQNKAGQPADLIAVHGSYHVLIDCKDVRTKAGFEFRRVEENQRCAMHLFQKRSGDLCWFALRLPDGDIRMISLWTIEVLEGTGVASMNTEECKSLMSLSDWLRVDSMIGR